MHWSAAVALAIATHTAHAADDPLAVSARLTDEKTLVVEITPAEGWSIDGAGIPKAFLQLEVPDGVTLDGNVLESRRELSRNEFLMAPYERMLDPGANTIKLSIDEAALTNAPIAVNVIAYMRRGEDGPARFVRRRLHVPAKAGATGAPADANNTTWGDNRAGLQVGDKAAPFSWQRADGTTVSLADHLGKSNILLTTYRAYW